MRRSVSLFRLIGVLLCAVVVTGQNNCYFGPGAKNRGPANLVPCNSTGVSSCCLLGDTCLSGNACFDYDTGNTYQYGCSDINYEHPSCPNKCGTPPHLSPWIGLDYCNDVPGVSDTWNCLSPESCACEWHDSYQLQILPTRACAAMGSKAIVALYAPSTLLAYVSLPSVYAGSTGYYSTTVINGAVSVIQTAISGYTPTSFTQFTTYQDIGTSIIPINPNATPYRSSSHAVATLQNGSTPPPDQPIPSSTSSKTARPTSSSQPIHTTHTTHSFPSSSSPVPTSVSHHSTTSTSAAGGSGSGTNPHHSTTPSGLSTDAKIGIGVGIGVGVVLLAAVIGLCIHRRRGRNQTHDNHQPTPPPQYPPSPEMTYHHSPPAPNNWPPANPHGMYHYIPVPPVVPEKDGTAVNISPPYSLSGSPPPPSELSADNQRRYMMERNSYYNPASAPYRSSGSMY